MYITNAETERLIIRRLYESDSDVWKKFFVDNPGLDFLGLDRDMNIEDQSKAWIEKQLSRYANNLFGHQALIEKESRQLIGQCGLLTQEIDGKIEIEIGYHILPKYWGMGYATEAAIMFRNYAFDNEITDTLISVIDIRNSKSMNVADKLGMTREEQLKMDGIVVWIYRINKKNWIYL
ncbi:GNAT family N-acetyltransferase [uncultured Draconibacterium sp.]|uniref:GNAT family N-acetyltransferase n=1 Tax=uncultured Draconibacterium sp. TaxID=1573823 RepID=UPI0029C9446A|nr:GNAT family N-acetyltransferase [uncultured Draconibacterium sp.]